jgi:hypothetical protein
MAAPTTPPLDPSPSFAESEDEELFCLPYPAPRDVSPFFDELWSDCEQVEPDDSDESFSPTPIDDVDLSSFFAPLDLSPPKTSVIFINMPLVPAVHGFYGCDDVAEALGDQSETMKISFGSLYTTHCLLDKDFSSGLLVDIVGFFAHRMNGMRINDCYADELVIRKWYTYNDYLDVMECVEVWKIRMENRK